MHKECTWDFLRYNYVFTHFISAQIHTSECESINSKNKFFMSSIMVKIGFPKEKWEYHD